MFSMGMSYRDITKHVEDYRKIMLETWEEMPQHFITSSSKDIGKDEVLNYIGELNENMISKDDGII